MKKSEILQTIKTRAEYLRTYKALGRAQAKGINTDLLDRFFGAMVAKGYGFATIVEAATLAAREGVFGYMNAWER
jgi:hypothetical protein